MPTTKQLEAISLFSGIDGLYEGCKEVFKHQSKLLALVERDKYSQQVLRVNYRGVAIFDDVSTFSNQALPKTNWNYEQGIIIGGSPCQGISAANSNGDGFRDSRSGLWREQIRIIQEFKPIFAIWENVEASRRPKQASDTHSPLGQVLRDFTQSGYDCQWQVIPLAALGAPHVRDRLFVVATAAGLLDRLNAQSWGDRLRTDRDNLLATYATSHRERNTRPKDRATNAGGKAHNAGVQCESGRLPMDDGIIANVSQSQPRVYSLDDGVPIGTSINRAGWWQANPTPTCSIPSRDSDSGIIADYAGAMLGIPRDLSNTQKFKQLGNAVSPIHSELVFMYVKYLWDLTNN